MSDHQARCAHLHVDYCTEDYRYDGPDVPNPDPSSSYTGLRKGQLLTRGWWECRHCHTRFDLVRTPSPVPSLATAPTPSKAPCEKCGAEVDDGEDGWTLCIACQARKPLLERIAELESQLALTHDPEKCGCGTDAEWCPLNPAAAELASRPNEYQWRDKHWQLREMLVAGVSERAEPMPEPRKTS